MPAAADSLSGSCEGRTVITGMRIAALLLSSVWLKRLKPSSHAARCGPCRPGRFIVGRGAFSKSNVTDIGTPSHALPDFLFQQSLVALNHIAFNKSNRAVSFSVPRCSGGDQVNARSKSSGGNGRLDGG
jgi:hypothetical protein